jgi:integrase
MFRKFVRAVKTIEDENILKQTMDEMYPDITTNSTVRTLEKICIANIATAPDSVLVEMLKMLHVVVPKISNDATIQNVFLGIRKALKNRYPEGSPMIAKSYKIMQFDQEKWRANRAAYNEKVFERNADKRQIDIKKVYDVMNLARQSQDPLDLAIGLQLACGGRISEILSYGQFTESKTDGYIIQKGILKQRGPDRREQVEKPIIHYTRPQFFEMLHKLREKLKPKLNEIKKGTYTHYELSQEYNNKINNRVKSLFGEALHSHDMRKIYANLSYDLFADKAKTSESSWISDVLGHSPNSLEVSKSYSVVALVDVPKDETAIPRNSRARDGHAYDRLLKTVEALKRNEMAIDSRVLKSYGYGSSTVEQYFKLKA